MTRLQIGTTVVTIGDGETVTHFADGLTLSASHEEQSGQRETADRLGIPVQQMNAEHDLVHSMLAAWLGLPHSPTLHGVATKNYFPAHTVEEQAVLGIQAFAHAAGVDLVELAKGMADGNGSKA